jgi:hypothetical protein
VAAGGKLLPEFGGDDAGAAVSGIAGYADAHRIGSVILHCSRTVTVIAM